MKTSASLSRVKRGVLCAGCGGCAAVAPDSISMKLSDAGYLRPIQKAEITAEEERAIAEICPGLGQSVDPAGRQDNTIWGPFVEMYTGWAKDAALRHEASSGGALSAILVHLLQSGAVDGVWQIAADPDRPVGNINVLSRSAEAVMRAAGSRYAPSAPLDGLHDLMQDVALGKLAFVGKPCDVAALRALQAREPRARERFPVLISFYCGGVPSLHGADQVVEALGKDPKAISEFRYRGRGWPGRATATDETGDAASMTYHESWGKILSHHVQHRCKICADGAGAAADIVCADAWETDDRGYPLFEELDGVSLVVARTELGQSIIRSAQEQDALAIQPFDVEQLTAIQRGQVWRRRGIWPRLTALRLLGKPVPTYKGLHVREVMRLSTPKEIARNFLGTIKRILTGRVRE
ncbi:MAG: Coenzyme F420 hydrogenase/dehydrogenase, beta subunit C-terminal domain [Arenibacterium sp.]